MGTQPLVVAQVRAFPQEVKVEIGQHRPEPVRIDNVPLMPLVALDLQAVHERLGPVAEHSLEQPVAVQPLHGNKLAWLAPSRSTTQAVRASGRKARITHFFSLSVPPGSS